jgi:hypothetical protein
MIVAHRASPMASPFVQRATSNGGSPPSKYQLRINHAVST